MQLTASSAKQSRLCGVFRACRNTCDIPEDLRGVTESLTSNFLNFGRKPAHFYATARSNLHETGLRAAPTALMRGPLKNDRLDARLIAEYVAIMPTRVVQRDAAVEKLAEIVTMRRQLCDEHVAVENQAAHLEDAMLRRLSKRRQMRLEADIRLLDKRLAEMVAGGSRSAL